ncbi:acyl transferase/acyl hydrolase/lysophospholipase [Pelagophyceae sp. CCMP2097]|nr:acyl transferase/acyl hydrolase/lysophospholipase [Pelagophyceae sp. CCMP2097]
MRRRWLGALLCLPLDAVLLRPWPHRGLRWRVRNTTTLNAIYPNGTLVAASPRASRVGDARDARPHLADKLAKDGQLNLVWLTLVVLDWRYHSWNAVAGLVLRSAQAAASMAVAGRAFWTRARDTAQGRSVKGAVLYVRGTHTVETRAKALAQLLVTRAEVKRSRYERLLSHLRPPLRVLCLDGGGIKGRNLFIIVAELERLAGRPAADLFDVVCGTSIGGCGALLVGLLGADATRAATVAFDELGARCFSKNSRRRFFMTGHSCVDERAQLICELCGGERLLCATSLAAALAHPKTFAVAARRTDSGAPEPFLFRTYAATDAAHALPGTSGATLSAAVDATSAAPTFFKPCDAAPDASGRCAVLADGGAAFNNPALLALHEVGAVWPRRRVSLIVSLGCGHKARRRRKPFAAVQTHLAAERVVAATLPDALYARLDPPLRTELKPTEWRTKKLLAMERETRTWLATPEVQELLRKVVERLG